jgi:HEPN domain-containing protein
MTKERLFKREYARELLNIAKNDLIAAKTLAQNPDVRYETVFFQLQQAVEKSLKSLLVAQSKSVPIVHDIALIIDRLVTKPENADALCELTDFAAIRRYEEGTFIVSQEETMAALTAVEQTIAFCQQQLLMLGL